MSSIELVIPAFNEEKRIEQTLHTYLQVFPKSVLLTIVLDGCTDNTQQVVTRIQQEYPQRIRIRIHTENKGKGAVIVDAWKQSAADWVGFVDADNATTPEQFQRLIATMEHNSQLHGVIASRFMNESSVQQGRKHSRQLMSKVFTYVVRLIFQLPYTDTQCGAKLFQRTALTPVLPLLHLNGMAFDVELLWRLKQHQARIQEVPIDWVDQPGSATFHSQWSFARIGVHMVFSLLRLRISG